MVVTRVAGWTGAPLLITKLANLLPGSRIENNGESCVVSELGNGVHKFRTEGGQGVVDRGDGVLDSSLTFDVLGN